MTSQTSNSTQPPGLSSFLMAAQDWLDEGYASSVVWQVLEAREQLSGEIKRALDAAIRNSGLRVPGVGFQLQDVPDAPTHHLHTPVFRKMEISDELTEAVLRAWVGVQGELYESVVQHLQWNDEPTYGPDRQERTFRGYWDAKDWQTNFNQFLADRTGFDHNDVGLMLWYVSGKLPPPASEVEDPSDRVDFERWKELLMALRPDAPQWEAAEEFAAAIAEIREEKEKQRARDAVNKLKTKMEDIWLEYSDELIYLERNIGLWASTNRIQPEVALETLAQVMNLELLLSQYRPIRDQAQSRSVESSRAGRRAEQEAEIISTVSDLEPTFSPSGGTIGFEAPTSGADSSLDLDQVSASESMTLVEEEITELTEEGDILTLTAVEPETDTICEEIAAAEMLSLESEVPQPLPPVVEEEQTSDDSVNASILAGLTSLREDIELLKAQLGNGDSAEATVDEEEAASADSAELEEPPIANDPPAVDGLNAVVSQAQERFPKQLLFRLNSESWVNGNPFEDPQSVLDALEWLATAYLPARLGDMDFAKLNESLYQACRWKYSNNRHDRAFFQNEGQYRMLVNGKAYFLNETIGKGVGEDPVNTIRIAFYWDRQRERVVVGYIGQHQLLAGE